MGRHSCCAKQKLRKGLWSPEEDQKLFNHITRFGVGCWSSVPKLAGLQRCGKSCRLRWINYLRPDLKRGMFSQQEEDIILSLHEVLGNRWAQIAAQLPGRTDNEIKNFWNSCLKKKLLKQGIDPATHKPFITQQQQQIIKQEIINNISETQPPPQQQVSLQHNDHFSNLVSSSVSPFLISNSTCYYDAPPFLTEASSRDEIINKPHQEWVDPLLSYYESYMTSHQQQQQQYQYYYGTSSNSYGIICSSSMPSLTSSDQNNLSSAITEFSDSKISSSNNSSNMSSYNNVMEVNNNNNSNNNNSGSFHLFHNEGDGVKLEEEVAVGLNNNNIINNNTSYLWQETVQLQNHNSVDFNGYPLMTSFSSQDLTPVTYDVLRHMHVNSSSL